MKKSVFLVLALLGFCISCFAQESDECLYDAKNAFNRAESFIEQSDKGLVASTCAGKWEFKNGKCVTVLFLSPSGVVMLTQTKNLSQKSWRGEWTASSTAIKCLMVEVEEKNGVSSESSVVNEQWTLNYILARKTISLVSSDLPNDMEDYSFANPTVFSRK